MRLNKCYIAGFGKLHDFSFEFQEGLNTVCQENGWGKTTFGVFIKAMFFGLEYNARKKLADNARKKYYPWQGGNFGGNIEFTVGEKEYKLERYFGKRDKEDTFCLYDKRTGLVSTDYSENIGEELFQIDAASYERSTYIPQNSIAVSMTDSINAKLSNLVENGNDINHYEKAYAKLEEHLKEYKKTGGRGKIAQLKEQIFAKQEEISECKNKAAGMALLQEQIEEQKIKKRGLKLRRDEIHEAVVRAGDQKEQTAKLDHYYTLKKREAEIISEKKPYDTVFAEKKPDADMIARIEDALEELHQLQDECTQTQLSEEEARQLNELDEFFAAGCPDSPEIEMYLGESREFDAAKAEIIRIQTRLELLKDQEEQEKQRQEEARREEQRKQQDVREAARAKAALWQRVFVTLGILSIAAGLVGFWFTMLAGIPGVALGILFLFLAVTRRTETETPIRQEADDGGAEDAESRERLREIEELNLELEKYEAEQAESHEHYQVFICQFPFTETGESPVQLLTRLQDKAAEYRRLSAREQELTEQRARLTGLIEEKTISVRERLGAVHEKYSMQDNLREACESLRKDKSEYERLTQELEKSREEVQEFAKNNEEIWQKISGGAIQSGSAPYMEEEFSLEELQNQGKQCEREIEEMDAKIHSYRKDMDNLSVIVERQTEFEEELGNLKDELEEAEYRAGILEKTMQYLKEAKESFSTHYMGTMRRGFARYASMINGRINSAIQLDVQLDAQLEVGGALKESEYFSAGNRDFIGICIRLALIDALFTQEKPFLILDDPFVNLDDSRVENARELLGEIAKEYQILYLVCHSSRA